ncbi:hypothetical protein DOTSEDRAFT_61607 [Dothistroma septosporum NZE10]|uniref:Uncharacterized protein n=1 Tax=Dothistroma septosporum (strain NZE10 / CBS 128990) TaxID=675120 RepID=N1PNM2_DOTSN|nr:hypothetical protein DOTSEDRAFT_61607 [Dothistroma septosporum NZE10]
MTNTNLQPLFLLPLDTLDSGTKDVPRLRDHDTAQCIGASKSPVFVERSDPEDKDMKYSASHGKAYTSSDIDYTIKVEVKGLKPYPWIHYQSTICGSNNKSPVGRTKTAPARIKIQKDIAAYVVLQGDSMCEYATSSPSYSRAVRREREIFMLYDNRTRLATSVQSHRNQRKMNVIRAYFERMPIRQVDMTNNLRICTSFSMRIMFDLIVLDTRNYDPSIVHLNWDEDYTPKIMGNDAGRTIMGSNQDNWSYVSLKRSEPAWRIIGPIVVFSTINHCSAGDAHLNRLADLTWLEEKDYDHETGAGAAGVGFAGTAVSSTTFRGAQYTCMSCNDQSRNLVADNPELQWQASCLSGYYETQNQQEGTAGATRLTKPVGSETGVRNDALQRKETTVICLALDTHAGRWFQHHENPLETSRNLL